MLKHIFVLLALSFFSCGTGKLLTAPDYVSKPLIIDTTRLRFDGYYSIVDKKYPPSNYAAVLPMVFKKNNKIFIDPGNFIIDRPIKCSDYTIIKPADFGIFIITGNEINAFVPTSIAFGDGAWYHTYSLHYKGYIKNRDTIVDFHAVPPFPKKFKKEVFSSSHNTSTFEPQTYIFIRNDVVNCLNSN